MGEVVIRRTSLDLSRSDPTVAQAELVERNRVLLALNELAAGLLRLDTPAAVYELALDGILRVMGATRGAIMVVDEEAGCFHLLRHHGYDAVVRGLSECLPFPTSLDHNKARLSGEIQIVHPDTASPIGRQVLASQQAMTGVLLPLRVGNRVTAILSYILDEYRDCPSGDRTLLETAATYTSAALERAILHEKMLAELTERRQAEQAAQSQRALLQTILDLTPVGIAMCDQAMRLTLFNRAWAEGVGLDPATPPGLPLYDLVPETRVAAALHQRVLAGETFYRPNISHLRPNCDTTRHYDQYLRPVVAADGSVTGLLSVVMDVTERFDRDQQKDVFMALASHELKTPVTTIKGFAQNSLRALAAESDPALRRRLTIINEQADLLTRLIDELLDTSQAQGEGLPLYPERFDLGYLVRTVAENLQLTAPDHTMEMRLAPDPTPVRADRQRMELVITNLVQNAIKYGGNARRVEITVTRQATTATVAVRDYGAGIPADQQARIFERFYRASNVRERQRGLGLGLYLAHTLVTRHGGRMWLDSTEGAGSTFYFSLPLDEL
jgi:PAS domain S-box-containing protein